MKSKLLLLIVFLVYNCFVLVSAPTHTVTANSLNVRTEAGLNGQKIGTLSKGDQIRVVGYSGSWAEIEYKDITAYVGVAYLEPIPTVVGASFLNWSSPDKQTIWSNVLVWSLLILLSGLAVLRYSREGNSLEGFELWLYVIVFLLTCFVELGICYLRFRNYEVYLFGLNNGLSSGLTKVIVKLLISGFILLFLLYNQIKSFFYVLNDLEYNSASVNYSIYKYSTGLSVIAALIFYLFLEDYLMYVFLFWAGCTTIQIGLIVLRTLPHWDYGFAISSVLITGSFTGIVTLVFFIWFCIIGKILY